MAVSKAIGYLFTTLIPLVLVNCQIPEPPSPPGLPGFPGMPDIPGFPGLPGLPGVREARQVASDLPLLHHTSPHPGSEPDHQDRFFFNFFPSFTPAYTTTCNSTIDSGYRCLNCVQAMRCFNNVGSISNCGHHKPVCNNGFCSKTPGIECYATTTTTTTTTTTAAN